MLRLRPYKAGDAQTITTWLKDEFALRQWSADRYGSYPITPADMNAYYDNEKDSGRSWGMRFPHADSLEELRLGFVIVDDAQRGRGYGKEMLSLAVRYAFEFVGVQKVSLGVFENNTAALHCYEACGFRRVEREQVEQYRCMGEVWRCIELERIRNG